MVTSFRIFVRACEQWIANQDSRLGAALAYYTLFSIAPLLVIAIHIAGFFFGEDAARGQVAEQLSSLVDTDTAKTIQNLVENASHSGSGGWALVSLVILIVGALGVFLNLRSALCIIFRLEAPKGGTWIGILLDYFLALLMVFGTGVLLLLSLAASMVVPVIRDMMNKQFPGDAWPWQILEIVMSTLFLTMLFAMIFRVLSDQRVPWRYVLYGSLVTAVLFSIGKVALGMYLVYSSTASSYGAAGSLVVFLIWVYYSSQILFFGAELVQARRTRHEWL